MKPPPADGTSIIARLLNIIAMCLFSETCLGPNIHYPWIIKSSWPPSATSYSNMGSWMPPKDLKILHQAFPKQLQLSCFVPAVSMFTTKHTQVARQQPQVGKAPHISSSYNDLHFVSLTHYIIHTIKVTIAFSVIF